MVKIRTAEDFVNFVRGNWKADAKLESDLDLSGVDIYVKYPNEFYDRLYYEGCFDGRGHIISGISFSRECVNPSVFPSLGSGGVIRDLTLAGEIVNDSAACGFVPENKGKIINCENRINITCDMDLGGIACINIDNGLIENCRNYGNLKSLGYVGGIAFHNHFGTIRNCTNFGEILTGKIRYKDIEAHNFTYNQIAATDIKGKQIGNHEKGRVLFPNNNSLLGQYLQENSIFEAQQKNFPARVANIARHDPSLSLSHVNDLGENYLHIITKRIRNDHYYWQLDPDVVSAVIAELITHEVDATALDKAGHTAVEYLEANPKRRRYFSTAIKMLHERMKEIEYDRKPDDEPIDSFGF